MTSPVDLHLDIKPLDLSKQTYKLKAKWTPLPNQDISAFDFFKQEYPGYIEKPKQYVFDFDAPKQD